MRLTRRRWSGPPISNRRASAGDPASDPNEDALGFLRTLIAEEETVQFPERIQVGMCGDDASVFLALVVNPQDG